VSGVAQHAAGRRLRALSEDQELPLARQRTSFPRLSSAARRAVRCRSSPPPTSSPSVSARSAATTLPLDRPDRQAADHQRTMTRKFVPPREMLRELMERQQAHGRCRDAQGPQGLPTTHEDSWRPPASSRTFIDETERRTWFLFEASASGRRQRGVISAAAVTPASERCGRLLCHGPAACHSSRTVAPPTHPTADRHG
jgi:hypothetical protein